MHTSDCFVACILFVHYLLYLCGAFFHPLVFLFLVVSVPASSFAH